MGRRYLFSYEQIREIFLDKVKLIKVISTIVALGQLALSQIHIGVITKVFEKRVGIFLFIFTLFCMLGLFMATRLSDSKDVIKHISINAIAIILGAIYLTLLNSDVSVQDFLTFKDIASSVYLTSISIVLLLIDSVLLCTVYKKI